MPRKKADSSPSAFKDRINSSLVERIAAHVSYHHKTLDKKSFFDLSKKLRHLELKARVQLIRDGLKKHLPENYLKALQILVKVTRDPQKDISALNGFDLWPFLEFVQTYGLQNPEESLNVLREWTSLFTSEWAVRPFLIHHQALTLKKLHTWSQDPNPHVRRWISEGTRPRLPWGEQLKDFIENPSVTLKLLEKLKNDKEIYVRKSVANHLNDISKDHPEVALKTAARWKKQMTKEASPQLQWVIRHGLRTLLKKGHPEALKILGFNTESAVQLKNLKINNKSLKIGETLEFEFVLKIPDNSQVMVDYIIHHQKSRGKTSEKVFKLTTKKIQKSDDLRIKKKHSFKAITTRTYYPGKHVLEIMVNGQRLGRANFKLI